MKNKLYHFYMDEGGMLGDTNVLISNKKIRYSEQENHISWYYKGKLYKEEISLYIDRFKRLFPKCKVNTTERIEIDFKTRRKFPREMMTSIDGKSWRVRLVFGKVNADKCFIVPIFESDIKGECVMGIKYAKEIEPTKKISLDSLKDLKDLKERVDRIAKENAQKKLTKLASEVKMVDRS